MGNQPNVQAITEEIRQAYTTYLGAGVGFLPPKVPLTQLPSRFEPFLSAADQLPNYFQSQRGVRTWLDDVFATDDPSLYPAMDNLGEMERLKLMTVFAVLGHAYRWNKVPYASAEFERTQLDFPAGLIQPWTHMAELVKQPRIGTLWNTNLCNWSMTDRPGGSVYRADELSMDTMQLQHNWLRGEDSDSSANFMLIFTLFEAKSVPVIEGIIDILEAIIRDDEQEATYLLDKLSADIEILLRVFTVNLRQAMVNAQTWIDLVQPFFAWGLETEEGFLGGPSGLNLGGIQCLNTALGLENESFIGSETLAYRRYMPMPHQDFLSVFDTSHGLIRDFVLERQNYALKQRFNDCVNSLRTWRVAHVKRAVHYLRKAEEVEEKAHFSTGQVIASGEDNIFKFERDMEGRIEETTNARTSMTHVITLENGFRYLKTEEIETLMGKAQRRTYQRHEMIIEQGIRRERLYIIRQGMVRVERRRGNQTVVLARRLKGMIFGEMSFLQNSGASASVIADDEYVAVDVIEREDVYQLLQTMDGFATRFYQSLASLLSDRLYQSDSLFEISILEDYMQVQPRTRLRTYDPIIEIPEIAHQRLAEFADGLDAGDLIQVQLGFKNIIRLLNKNEELGTFFRRELYRYLSQSPLFERIINGYIQETTTLDLTMAGEPQGINPRAKLLDDVAYQWDVVQSLRARRFGLVDIMREILSFQPDPALNTIASLMSGTSPEMFELLQDEGADTLEFSCVSADSVALKEVNQRADKLGLDNISILKANVLALARGHSFFPLAPQRIIYAPDLLDYLDEKDILKFLNWAFDSLAHGGTLLLGAFIAEYPAQNFMAEVLDWMPLAHTDEQLKDLFMRSEFGTSPVEFRHPAETLNRFILCTKV